MKKLLSLVASMFLLPAIVMAGEGWPANYGGVMLQGFYWDSFSDSQWTVLEGQADELAKYFTLIWVPQSGKASNSKSMGYDPKYYWNQNSTFGTENQLRSMIKTFKSKGLGTIADVVINHRANMSNWVDFPKETYKGVTYEMFSTDICSDDDGGKTSDWATKNGYKLSSNKDSGEGWDGMRDLDHSSANVQKCIMAYEDYLLNDLGYVGFRYDVAKGFSPYYFGLYNSNANPEFSVGECWDSNQTIKNWINGTTIENEKQSAAFDFQFRYQVRDAINTSNWSKVAGSNCLVADASYKRYSVTFLENHDTEKRKDAYQDPILRDTLAANAYMLSMPGTPCVFFKHWQKYKRQIKLMIEARKLAGIHNQSVYSTYLADAACTAICVTGTKGKLLIVVGTNAKGYKQDGFKELMSGPKYKYLVENTLDTSEWTAIVQRVNEETVDPEKPTLPECATPQDGIYAYFEKPASWGETINVWAWYNNASHSNLYDGCAWPGYSADTKKVGDNKGYSVYLWKYSGTKTKPDMIIFNDGTSQTVDLQFANGGYYTDTDGLIGVVSGIDTPVVDVADGKIYHIDGRYVGTDVRQLVPGLYVRNGKKIMVR